MIKSKENKIKYKHLVGPHSFHIPVMGTAFTIDTPIRIAKFGISSVISIGDDELCEEMRKVHSEENNRPFTEIKKWDEDYRARRITAYLNLVQELVTEQMNELKSASFESSETLNTYFELLPDASPLKQEYIEMNSCDDAEKKAQMQTALKAQVVPGNIDVNIMTKLDRSNYDRQGNLLDDKYSDAVSALRGFANSTLESGVVFSAGFNRRLFAQLEGLSDFYPDENGYIKKKIILKVSDYRSSWTQGKFLAKKGIWISEYRVESGLNCGGHAFATEGVLMGPILDEFKQQRDTLVDGLYEIYSKVLSSKAYPVPTKEELPNLITVQGGIGTANEQQFLLTHYELQRTGWATPFLLVPEVTILDDETRAKLTTATKKDLYLSGVSPLGVPFNTLRGTASEAQKQERIEIGKPGSACPKGHLVNNTEFTEKPICTASRLYQNKKIKELNSQGLSVGHLKTAIQKVVDKVCLCEDLAASSLIQFKVNNKRSLKTAVCSGPNMAYFSKLCSLSEMVGHIYGRVNVLNQTYRANMLINEFKMYIDHFRKEMTAALPVPTKIQRNRFIAFRDNLLAGATYYKDLIPKLIQETAEYRHQMKEDLNQLKEELDQLIDEYQVVFKELPCMATA